MGSRADQHYPKYFSRLEENKICFIIFLFIITGKSLVPKQTNKMEKTEYATSENPTRKSQVSHLVDHSVKVVY